MVELGFVFIVVAILGSIAWYSYLYGISPTPTSAKVKNCLLRMIPSSFNGKVIELGSGWGTLAIALAHKLPEKPIDAFEISLVPYLFSKIYSFIFKSKNLKIFRADFFSVPIEDYGLVICYLYPKAMDHLKEKFIQELNPGTFIVTHTFAIQGWEPKQEYIVDDLYRTPIYLYQIHSGSENRD